jgi:hypothetical protein
MRKNRNKIKAKKNEKIKGDKKPNQKRRKCNKMLSQKSEKRIYGAEKSMICGNFFSKISFPSWKGE